MTRDRIIVSVLLIIGTLSFLWWLLSSMQRDLKPQIVTQTPRNEPTVVPFEPASPPVPTEVKQMPGGPYEPRDPRWQWWNKVLAADKKFEWKMPINFYGKVVDENGQPVAGAKIEFSWTDLTLNGTSESQITSDQHGQFSLTEQHGKRLQVRVSKEGYHRSQEQSAGNFEYAAFFEPSYYHPDSKAPVIFRLRRKANPEPLIMRQTLYGIRIDGTPHYIDLTTGNKTVGGAERGDIAVRLVRPEKSGQRFNWSLVLEGVNGTELMESTNELLFTAPVKGYQPKLEYEMKAEDPSWIAGLQKRLFVRGQNGRLYALLQADVMATYNEQAAIDLVIYVNPQPGSRNLEYDPATQAAAR